MRIQLWKEPGMVTVHEVRALALSLPETEEQERFIVYDIDHSILIRILL